MFLKKFFHKIELFFFIYPTPINLKYLWNFGVLSLFFFIIQFITGLCLSMFYIPHVDYAFISIDNIMRNINYGWIIRYLHINGASFFFLAVYFHIFRNLYYKLYLPPKFSTWNIGIIIFFLMIIIAFTGYVLPWGQMSFWAATVITNLFSSFPIIGENIVYFLWGDYCVSTFTLNRFFSFHFLLPFILLIFIFIHLILLHEKGSDNPLLIYNNLDKIPFHSYYTIKDLMFILIILLFFIYLLAFYPDILGHPDNHIMANPLVTPEHIVPEWYFLFFYAILRSVPSKLGGVFILFLSIFILSLLPIFFNKVYIKNFSKFNLYIIISYLYFWWLKVCCYWILPQVRFRIFFDLYMYCVRFIFYNLDILYKFFFFIFVFCCIFLSILGSYPVESIYIIYSRCGMCLYFIWLFYLMFFNIYEIFLIYFIKIFKIFFFILNVELLDDYKWFLSVVLLNFSEFWKFWIYVWYYEVNECFRNSIRFLFYFILVVVYEIFIYIYIYNIVFIYILFLLF